MCGLYCKDCIPSNEKLFNTLKELKSLLADTKFENYVQLKVKREKTFKKYSDFLQVLEVMGKLECKNGCYHGPVSELGCKSDCQIRICVLKKKYNGCWDCEEHVECELLKPQKKIHPSLDQNLAKIKKYGVNNWAYLRGPHYCW
ncbi:MAG: DUF3795 domain-containing protein [Candidatus Margulisbacteria bacterium]|nr:DUF3795 domain-containing protein [Candidatus Margulisiibacteriota bacterium]